MEQSVEAFILTAEARTIHGSSALLLYAASNSGPVEVVSSFAPYFFVTVEAKAPAGQSEISLSKETFTSLSGEKVKRWSFTTQDAAERTKEQLKKDGSAIYESDLRIRDRFLMDHRINGAVRITGRARTRNRLTCFHDPLLTPIRTHPALRILSLDIETSITTRGVISIGGHLSGRAPEEQIVFMLGEVDPRAASYVHFVATERALLATFLQWLQDTDPDIIIGWNVIGFDLAYLKERAEALRLPLPLGRDRRPFTISEGAGRFSRANVPGRVVLDGPQLLRSSFYSFESYSLEYVAQKILGEGKLIAPGNEKVFEIERLFKNNRAALAEYNIKDAQLVTRIFEKLTLLELTIKRTELSGMLLDLVGMSTASFDHFYLPRLHQEGFVAPDVGDTGAVTSSAGGYVMSPLAGMYHDIVGLDFQSLYPSIIRTFNIDPLSRACAFTDPLTTPSGFTFSRTRSILPRFIEELMNERGIAKQQNNKSLSQAVKILMNSFYGVMGSPGSRLYHPALPEAITTTGQWLLVESKHWLEDQGHKVIYGDTDSLFVALKQSSPINDFAEHGRTLADALSKYWKARLQKEFKVSSYLVVDFKKYYKKFLVPPARAGEGGAKKRYAGLVVAHGKEEVEFVGLEVVRSDWTRLARDFQVALYTRVFRGEAIDTWVRDFVNKVRSGEFDEKLVYRKRLHKAPDEYGKSPPPYVRAAKMLNKPTREVRYVITLQGPIPIQLSPKNPDYDHYVDRQLRPVADSILEVIGTSFEEILSAQLRLW